MKHAKSQKDFCAATRDAVASESMVTASDIRNVNELGPIRRLPLGIKITACIFGLYAASLAIAAILHSLGAVGEFENCRRKCAAYHRTGNLVEYPPEMKEFGWRRSRPPKCDCL